MSSRHSTRRIEKHAERTEHSIPPRLRADVKSDPARGIHLFDPSRASRASSLHASSPVSGPLYDVPFPEFTVGSARRVTSLRNAGLRYIHDNS